MPLTQDSMMKAELELIEGIKRSDVSILDRLMHDDLRFLIPNGQMITKQMDLESHARGDMTVESLAPVFEEVKVVGDTATVVVVYETKGVMLGNPIQGKFRYIRIWKEFEGGPKILGGACFMV